MTNMPSKEAIGLLNALFRIVTGDELPSWELEDDGKKVYRTTLSMRLVVRRYNAVVPLRIDTGTEETESCPASAAVIEAIVDYLASRFGRSP